MDKAAKKNALKFQWVILLWFRTKKTQHLVFQKITFKTPMFITCLFDLCEIIYSSPLR
jgi:hypothetical protein